MGYVDFGFANAGGNGTSFPPGDNRLPADYGVDTFAPAVNSRGDVASIDAGGRFDNGFLPRSVNIGGRPSFLLNIVNQDLRYQAPHVPVMAFVAPAGAAALGRRRRGQRHPAVRRAGVRSGHADRGPRAFRRRRQVRFRVRHRVPRQPGELPHRRSRRRCSRATRRAPRWGVKAFYRQQIPALWSALSLNVAATNGANFVEALQPTDASLTGVPVVSARFGYELNLPRVQVKLGASGLRGPRNDQFDREALLTMFGFDARLLRRRACRCPANTSTSTRRKGRAASRRARAAIRSPRSSTRRGSGPRPPTRCSSRGPLRAITPYARYERRHAWFEGFRPITVARVTAGLRLDLWESLDPEG